MQRQVIENLRSQLELAWEELGRPSQRAHVAPVKVIQEHLNHAKESYREQIEQISIHLAQAREDFALHIMG